MTKQEQQVYNLFVEVVEAGDEIDDLHVVFSLAREDGLTIERTVELVEAVRFDRGN